MENNKRKSFMFYLSWEKQLALLNFEQQSRFIHNLIKYHKKEHFDFVTDLEEAIWIGIETALEINDEKWLNQVKKNRENGKLGGRPKKQPITTEIKHLEEPVDDYSITQKTERVISEPKKPVNSKESIDNSKKLTDNSKQEIVNSEMLIENSEGVTEYCKKDIERFELRKNLSLIFRDYKNWEKDLSNESFEIFFDKTKKYHEWNKQIIENIKLFKSINNNNNNNGSTF